MQNWLSYNFSSSSFSVALRFYFCSLVGGRIQNIYSVVFWLHGMQDIESLYRSIVDTDLPAYSDTLGTWGKCHCKQIVTVSRGSLVTNQSFGTCQKCHCKRGVTVNSVTVSGEICTEFKSMIPSGVTQ